MMGEHYIWISGAFVVFVDVQIGHAEIDFLLGF